MKERGRRAEDIRTSDNGHSEEWTTSLQWINCVPPGPYISTSKEGATFKKLEKMLVPNVSIIQSSTVDKNYEDKIIFCIGRGEEFNSGNLSLSSCVS